MYLLKNTLLVKNVTTFSFILSECNEMFWYPALSDDVLYLYQGSISPTVKIRVCI